MIPSKARDQWIARLRKTTEALAWIVDGKGYKIMESLSADEMGEYDDKIKACYEHIHSLYRREEQRIEDSAR